MRNRECDPSILKPNFRHNRTSHFPNISKPKIVGSFSVDKLRTYQNDNSNLKYLVLPKDKKFSFNLNEGFELYQFKPEQSHAEKIDHLLSYILKNLDKSKQRDDGAPAAGQFLRHDFVCFRGLMRLLMCTPYEFRESWSILATKYKGTIYLCAKELEEKRMERLNATDMSKKICAYGFKFEQFILAGADIYFSRLIALI
jgi:RAT1-interacting protein